MTEAEELLLWIAEQSEIYGEFFAPSGASTDFNKQEETWNCYGCGGSGKAKWPDWKVEFSHSPDCKWLKYKSLIEKLREREVKG